MSERPLCVDGNWSPSSTLFVVRWHSSCFSLALVAKCRPRDANHFINIQFNRYHCNRMARLREMIVAVFFFVRSLACCVGNSICRWQFFVAICTRTRRRFFFVRSSSIFSMRSCQSSWKSWHESAHTHKHTLSTNDDELSAKWSGNYSRGSKLNKSALKVA